MKTKALVVVQCRFNSSRLCGKALYPIAGIPMLAFLLRRLKNGLSENQYHIILATSDNEPDQVVAMWGMREGVDVVRGDEEDVLKRYILSLDKYKSSVVVRVTADNPLTCPEILDLMVKDLNVRNLDYIQTKGLPYGAGVDVFSAKTLQLLDQDAQSKAEREHINLHILENPDKFKTETSYFEDERARPDLNMTVDTMEDWQRVASLFETEERKPWNITLREAIARMDNTPFPGS